MQCACAILSSVVCPALQYFSTLSHKRHDLKKYSAFKMCILILSVTFVGNIFHFKKNWATYDKIFILVFMSITRYSCPISVKFEFSWKIFENCLNIKFHENPSIESGVVPGGQTHRRTDMKKTVVAFCNFSNTPKAHSRLPSNKKTGILVHNRPLRNSNEMW
jgi:hypothetical protein